MDDRGPAALTSLLTLTPVQRMKAARKYTKDMQRRRVYAAENIALKDIKTAAHGQEMSLEESQVFVNKVWASKWARKNFFNRVGLGTRPPVVRHVGGHGYARGNRWSITLPRWSRTKIVLLHELAHALSPVQSKHDRLWARIFLMLLDRWLDPIYGKQLRVEFRARKVKYSAPKRLAPATREMLRTRAATMFSTYNYNVKN